MHQQSPFTLPPKYTLTLFTFVHLHGHHLFPWTTAIIPELAIFPPPPQSLLYTTAKCLNSSSNHISLPKTLQWLPTAFRIKAKHCLHRTVQLSDFLCLLPLIPALLVFFQFLQLSKCSPWEGPLLWPLFPQFLYATLLVPDSLPSFKKGLGISFKE